VGHQIQRPAAQRSRDDRHLTLNRKTLRPVPIDARRGAFASFGSAPAPLRACALHHSSCLTFRLRFNFTSAGCLNYPCRTPASTTTKRFPFSTEWRDDQLEHRSGTLSSPSTRGFDTRQRRASLLIGERSRPRRVWTARRTHYLVSHQIVATQANAATNPPDVIAVAIQSSRLRITVGSPAPTCEATSERGGVAICRSI
jgi:hypothetical protein